MSHLFNDLRFGLRSLRRDPVFSIAAVTTLALGIGAACSVFTVVHAVLLRPLPYEASDELVVITGTHREAGRVESWPISYLDFVDFRQLDQVFEQLAACSNPVSLNLEHGGSVERIRGELVSAGYFRAFGVEPRLGRRFSEREAGVGARAGVAIVGHALWQRRYGGDPGIVGRTLQLDARSFTVVGVMPPGFSGLTDEAEVWLPATLADEMAGHGSDYLEDRMARWLTLVGSLEREVGVGRAQEALDELAASLENEYPDSNEGHGARVERLREAYSGGLRAALLTLLGSVGFVLLIACVNVSNLLLARGVRRRREYAVRTALGAPRGRLVAQLVTESLLMALAAAALGLWLAELGTRSLVALAGVDFQSFVDLGLDPVAIGATVLASLACGLGFGALPAWFTSSAGCEDVLRQGGRGTTPGRHRFQKALIVSEVALALVLLAGAGLTIRSFESLSRRDLGFRPEGVLTARFDLKEERYTENARRNHLVSDLLEAARGVPGLGSAAMVGPGIPTDDWHGLYFLIDERTDITEDAPVLLPYHAVTPGYFTLLGIPLLAGRDFTAADTATAPHVIIVSRALAERYWPGREPIGRRLKNGPRDSDAPWLTVVGVVADVRNQGLADGGRPGPDVYLPIFQNPPMTAPTYALVVRPERDGAAGLAEPLREAVRRTAPALPLYDVRELRQHLGAQAARDRFLAILMALFAAIALGLGAVGIYGVVAYGVSQRRREIGVRMALGARRRGVLGLVLRQAMTLVIAGVSLGLTTVFVLGRFVAGLLHGVGPSDPAALGIATLVLLLVGLLASLLPARSAMKVDPITAID